jgi:tRNA A-37 threonylcarbamoyl transferase component Bud32
LLAERYRIIALLGRGGMGEVYRADDLTLGQQVALKFLPEATVQDEATLERFRNEVRIARRISHPNVCRIYDIGEANGLPFLSMEYVDGEDLGSLLRRIGRLPSDKALEIARKLCAGLAAAHDKGVLHRDLKPANIMLNSEGEVVIMDFGLADLAEHIPEEQVHYGTPAYMAPEQLAGKEVTAKSDIYALGLVLYELFTGKRAFQAETLAEIVRSRTRTPLPANPASLVRDLDPGVERVILRCLDPDPAMRPASALAVAAALPGGDPLAAALAAGETPSPQMVAAAGEVEALAPRIAIPCLVILLLGLLFSYFLGVNETVFDKMQVAQSPDVLRHYAQEIASKLGYTAQPADTAYGFDYDYSYSLYARGNDKPHANWDDLLKKRPSLIHFWYRSSPQPMVSHDYNNSDLVPGIVTHDQPPVIISGMIEVFLDLDGKLVSFQAIPLEREDKPKGAKPVDWAPLFAAADLDPKTLTPAEPLWNSLAASDTRAAWTGAWPSSNRPLRVEAAALHGTPVRFALYGPWTTAWRQNPDQSTKGQRAAGIILIAIACTVLIGGVLLAIRNYRADRSDLNGAFRLGLFVFFVQIALWIFSTHFVASTGTFGNMVLSLSTSLYWGTVIALVYLALEPYVRRRWPRSIISWSRLLLGRWRDPLVGRDVLFGLLLGLFWVLFIQVFVAYLIRRGDVPHVGNFELLLGGRHILSYLLYYFPDAIQGTLLFFFLIFLLRLLLRNEWLAAAAFVILWSVMKALQDEKFWIAIVAYFVIYSLAAIAVVRFGLISLASAFFLTDFILDSPITGNSSNWFFASTIFIYSVAAALAVWAFYTALAGQKLLKEELFE